MNLREDMDKRAGLLVEVQNQAAFEIGISAGFLIDSVRAIARQCMTVIKALNGIFKSDCFTIYK